MENHGYFLPFIIILIFLLLERRKQKIAVTYHNIKKKRKDIHTMKELAKQFMGKECIIYTVADNFGNIQGVIKDVNDTGITVENKQGLQAVNLDYVVRICEYPRKKNGKKKSVVLD